MTGSWISFPSYGNMVCMAPPTVFDLFLISYGRAGGIICVLQTHFIFEKSLLTKQICPYLSRAGAYFFSSYGV
jgi:hypothetical protein